jgi:hypothetical protein
MIQMIFDTMATSQRTLGLIRSTANARAADPRARHRIANNDSSTCSRASRTIAACEYPCISWYQGQSTRMRREFSSQCRWLQLSVCRPLAHHDRPPFSGRPSLTGHCGHGWTSSLPGPVASDPKATSNGPCNRPNFVLHGHSRALPRPKPGRRRRACRTRPSAATIYRRSRLVATLTSP